METTGEGARRVAFISGAGRRLGRAIALHLAAQGWFIAAHYNSAAAEAEALQQEIEALGAEAALFQADLSDPEAVIGLCARVVEQLGAPDLVLNNASVFERDRVGEFDHAMFGRQIALNVTQAVICTEQFARLSDKDLLVVNMLDQKVTNFSSDYLSYTMSKVALEAAGRMHALTLGPKVRVNGIAPGLILHSGGQSDASFHAIGTDNPLKKIPEVREICAAVDFFIEAPSVTGEMIYVDSGRHLVRNPSDDDMKVS